MSYGAIRKLFFWGFEKARQKNGLLGRRKKAGDLKEERLYYLRSENKAADQLHSYCTADLQLCF